jgi:hypothetical protein
MGEAQWRQRQIKLADYHKRQLSTFGKCDDLTLR